MTSPGGSIHRPWAKASVPPSPASRHAATRPVELVIDLPQRPSPAIETIAYFCAAELLTNAAKHSGAQHAKLEVLHSPAS